MRVIFMGTPQFAIPSLARLIEDGHTILMVITQPDKAAGRGKKMTKSPVKIFAMERGIRVFQPETLKKDEVVEVLKKEAPDLLITVAYGKILTQAILDTPRYGCINVHASLLPKYRGAAPIQWAIMRGETETGITTMMTDKGLDTGDMLLRKTCSIGLEDTAESLHDQLSQMGAEVLSETLDLLEKGKLVRTPQDNNEATYAPLIQKQDGRIAWEMSAEKIHHCVRGLYPFPGAYTFYQGKKMRVCQTHLPSRDEKGDSTGAIAQESLEIKSNVPRAIAQESRDEKGDSTGSIAQESLDIKSNAPGAIAQESQDVKSDAPGTIVKADKSGMWVCSGEGLICITSIQFESCKRMTVAEYLCGNTISEGVVLGE